MIEAVVDFRRGAVVSCPVEVAWALLVDVPRSASHFPDVVSLAEQDGVYTWKLLALGAGNISVQTVYGCRYEVDDAKREIRWIALPSVGNARVSGSWRVDEDSGRARVELINRFALDVPVPRLLAPAARPIVTREANRLLEGYFDNVVTTLTAGDDRRR